MLYIIIFFTRLSSHERSFYVLPSFPNDDAFAFARRPRNGRQLAQQRREKVATGQKTLSCPSPKLWQKKRLRSEQYSGNMESDQSK
jgi:hypothetical protein